MTDFDRWLSFAVGDLETITDADVRNGLAGEEGGWNQNDPQTDPPGQNPTFRGIEFNEWRHWHSSPTWTQAQFRTLLTRTEIGQIALAQYWEPFHVNLLPAGATILYQDGVWVGGGVENLQMAMNGLLGAGLTIDNELGPATLAAMQRLAAIPAQQIIASYTLAAQARYRALGRPEDLAGWLGRLGRCKALATSLLEQNTQT
jgi:lysozyme family protein